MSYNDDYQKEQARRIARGEPLSNEEVLRNMDVAKKNILERGAHGPEGSEGVAQDVAKLVDQGKVFVQEKNPNQELQKIQHAGKRLAKHAPTTGNAQQKYFEQMQERYDDLAELASRMVYSRGTRRIIRRVQSILMESLSSAAGQFDEKLESGARQREHGDQSFGQSDYGDSSTGQSGYGDRPRKQTEYGDRSTWQTGQSDDPSSSGQSTGQGQYSDHPSSGLYTGQGQHGDQDQHSGQTGFGDLSSGQTGFGDLSRQSDFSDQHHPGQSGFGDISSGQTGSGDHHPSGQTGFGDLSSGQTGFGGHHSSGQTGFGDLSSGQTGFGDHHHSGQTGFGDLSSGQTGFGDHHSSGQTGFGDLSTGQTGSSGLTSGQQTEYKDRPIGEPSALSGPDSFGYGIHEGEGRGSGSGHDYGSGSMDDFEQQDTMHTRRNYKVIIRGQEYNFLKDDISDENKEWVAEEAQNICIDIASDENLKESASAFVRIIKSASQVNIEKPELNEEAKKALEDSKNNLRSLLDHLAEGYDFDRMEKAWDRFIEKTKRNDELERDWKDFFGFIKESFLSKRLAMSQDWTNNFTCKLDCLRDHLMSFKPELFNLLQEFDRFMQALKDDKFISETSQSVDKLSKDLFLDKNGNFEFKPEALKQIRDVIAPEVFEQFKYIAIPTFRDEDDTQSSEISNAVFKSEGLSPDDVLIQNTTDIKLTRKDENVFKTSIHVLIKGMNFDIQDMHIKYHRKVFPQIKDEGNFNVRSTGNKGVKLEMWLSASAEDAEIFKVDDVDCTISGLRIYDSHVQQYTFLFTIFKPLLQSMMRKEVEKAIENKIKQTAFSLRGLKGL
jgi:hypothetical protein